MKRYIAQIDSNGQSFNVTVLENSLGPISWNTNGVGTLTGAFKQGRTIAFIGSGQGGEQASLVSIEVPANSEDYVAVKGIDVTAEGAFNPTNAMLVRTGIMIFVY